MMSRLSNDELESKNREHSSEASELTKGPSMLQRIIRRASFIRDGESNSDNNAKEEAIHLKDDTLLPPLSTLEFQGYKPNTKRRLMNEDIAENIRGLLPPRLQLFDKWSLIYSSEQHGISLHTLYQKCNLHNQLSDYRKLRQESGYAENVVSGIVGVSKRRESRRPLGYILVIKDNHNYIFGAYLNQELQPVDHRRYYGNGECFLWKYEPPKEVPSKDGNSRAQHSHPLFKAFVYTGMNDNLIYSNQDFFAIGSSNGQNGIWIDSSLNKGVSCPCETFGNEILTAHETGSKIGRFKVVGLELWRVGDLE